MNTRTKMPRIATLAPLVLVLAFVAGCARPPGALRPDDGVRDAASELDRAENEPDYDPWQPFNEAMFAFNHDVLDRWLMKPAATGWEFVVPVPARRSLARAFANLEMPRRFVNNVLQLRPEGAARELARFALNTTLGVGGLFDVATALHIEKSDADVGQTLALYGVAAGPYLVLPTMPPLTVRDAIGRTADGMLDPVGYFLPFVANQVASVVSAINERSLNLQLYADVEESVLDLYSAARNGYLQRRRNAIRRAAADRFEQWAWAFDERDDPRAPQVAASAAAEDPS
jgi:phospholipid-binding lipoprotein MlaA